MAEAPPGWSRPWVHGLRQSAAGEALCPGSARSGWHPPGQRHLRPLQPDAGWTPLRAPVCPGDATTLRWTVHRVGEAVVLCCRSSGWRGDLANWQRPSDAIKAKTLTQKPSSAVPGRRVVLKEQKVPSGVGVRYLFQPGELEGGRRRATDPVWSLEVYRLGRSVNKPDEPVLYYLQSDDAPQRGSVREELLAVPSDTQLPPDRVLRRWTNPQCKHPFPRQLDIPQSCVHMPACPPHFLPCPCTRPRSRSQGEGCQCPCRRAGSFELFVKEVVHQVLGEIQNANAHIHRAIDLFHIVFAHACIGHVTRYFSIIGETLQRWGERIWAIDIIYAICDNHLF